MVGYYYWEVDMSGRLVYIYAYYIDSNNEGDKGSVVCQGIRDL